MKKRAVTILLLALALSLSACRVRTTLIEPEEPPAAENAAQEPAVPMREDAAVPEILPEEPDDAAEPAQSDAPALQDESSERREYAPDASGELTPEAETPLYAETQEPAEESLPAAGGAGESVNAEADGAEQTATETVPADEAEQTGVDESGEIADSVQTYYLTLLSDRVGELFECKRLYVYWETEEDHRTVFRDSPEHRIITGAGAYDVSAKLLEENLTVDDGWISRKNPDAVVKVTERERLPEGAAVCDALAARPDWAALAAVQGRRILLLSRELLETPAGQTAAMVYLAKLLYPEQLADVDADEALRALSEEMTGTAWSGRYAYAM